MRICIENIKNVKKKFLVVFHNLIFGGVHLISAVYLIHYEAELGHINFVFMAKKSHIIFACDLKIEH